MSKGDHLVVSRGAYLHHGVDLGDGRVVQYGGGIGLDCCVEVVDMAAFSEGRSVRVENKPAAYEPDEIVERALGRLGEQSYSLPANNCEHFVNWCRTGSEESRQVETISERIVSSTAKLAINSLAKVVLKGSTKTAAKTVTRAATPWLLAADAAQLATEVVASQMGVEEKDVETVGRMVGFGSSVGIGAALAGRMGAVVGGGVWAVGEVVGQQVTSSLLPGLGQGSTLSEGEGEEQTVQLTEEIFDPEDISQEKPDRTEE